MKTKASPQTTHFFRPWALVLAALALFMGCAPFSPDPRPAAPEEMPGRFEMYTEEGEAGPARWWEGFESPELTRLVETALAGNFSLQSAWARLRQARAEAVQTGADLLPTVSVEAEGQRKRTKTRSRTGQVGDVIAEEYSLGLAASYELDLWGRLRSLNEAESLDVRADRADLDTAAMTVAATVAETWVQRIAAEEKLRLIQSQARTNEVLLEILRLRFENSLVGALDVLQQQEALAGVWARAPSIEAQKTKLGHALALLLGQPPATDLGLEVEALPQPPPLPKAGLPADLLAQRPDVRAAGLRLSSADWRVAAARADRLPNLTLTGSFTFYGQTPTLAFNNWIANLAAGLVGPIFDGGRRAAEVERTRAVVDERIAGYKETVLGAVGEVEDALADEKRQREYIAALEIQRKASALAYEKARDRYLAGLDNFINLLGTLSSLQSLDQTLVQARADLLLYRIALHRALGGGWTDRLGSKGLLNDKEKQGTSDDGAQVE